MANKFTEVRMQVDFHKMGMVNYYCHWIHNGDTNL